jgi:hypothetical protein
MSPRAKPTRIRIRISAMMAVPTVDFDSRRKEASIEISPEADLEMPL